MPEPDITMADGSKTYSLEGLKQLLEWNTLQVESRLLPKVDERLKPLTEREKIEKQRAEQDSHAAVVRERTQKQMAEAQTWPMFGKLAEDGSLTPFQQEVLDHLKADKALDLRGAYMKAFLPKYAEDDKAKRERIFEEMNSAPTSTAVRRTEGDAPKPSRAKTTAQIAAEIVKNAGG